MNLVSLQTLIVRGDYKRLGLRSKEIAKRVDRGDDRLIYHIGAHKDHAKGRIMFQIFKRACDEYRWDEIMKVMGKSLMVGSIESQNLFLLEHAMCHVDEKELYDRIDLGDGSSVSKWYVENFT